MAFTCPYLQVQITKPCNANSCSFHIKRKEYKNCLMQYSTNDNNTLTLAEVAYFKQMNLNELKATQASAMHKIYTSFVKNQLVSDVPVHYLSSGTVCVATDSLTEEPVALSTGHVIERTEMKFPKVVWERAIELSTTPERLLQVIYKMFPHSTIDKFFHLPAGAASELQKLSHNRFATGE